MYAKQFLNSVGALAVLALAWGAAPVAAQTVIKADGSSTVFPISEAVAEEFQAQNRDVRVTVGVSGTGGGFRKFCRGETDISNASRPISKSEMEACRKAGFDGTTVVTGPRIGKNGVEYIELPIAFDAITVVVHKDNTWASEMTVAEFKTMWEPAAAGKITNWKQVNPKFPDMPLALFGPGADSGTFEYFTEAMVGKAKASRGDFTASEDDNVLVMGVSRDKGGLGYFGMAYYLENQDKLNAVKIIGKEGQPAVAPSPETVIAGTYQPLSRPIFIYVNALSLQKPEVRKFVEFYLQNASQLAKEVGYVPLPASAYQTALEHVKKGKLGTVFGGVPEIGITIEELLKREAKL
jgi:phosphate transport system substrate-binding protein